MTAREELHELIDEIDDHEVLRVRLYVEELRDHSLRSTRKPPTSSTKLTVEQYRRRLGW